jgi:hypothetical protein
MLLAFDLLAFDETPDNRRRPFRRIGHNATPAIGKAFEPSEMRGKSRRNVGVALDRVNSWQTLKILPKPLACSADCPKPCRRRSRSELDTSHIFGVLPLNLHRRSHAASSSGQNVVQLS